MSIKGTHWYNNGLTEIQAQECPEGFVPGMLTSSKEKNSQSLKIGYASGKIVPRGSFKAATQKKVDAYNELLKRIPKEEFYQKYIVEDLSHVQIQELYGISTYTVDKIIREYDLHKSKKQSSLRGLNTKYQNAGGKENYFESVKQKSNQTLIDKYGSLEGANEHKSDQLKKSFIENNSVGKINDKKRENNTFNVSKPENDFYIYLSDLFGSENVIRQYNSNCYPFNCDFYIIPLDMYIELNFNWTHGSEPFTGTKLQLNKLEEWKRKSLTSKFFQNAIDVWTVRDVNKLNLARENKLNFRFVYTEEELCKLKEELESGRN